MQTIVEIDPSAVADLAAWRRTLDANPVIQRRLAGSYTDALRSLLIESEGLPPSGRVDPNASPPRYWHELTGGTWAEYTVAVVGHRFSRRRVIAIGRLVPLPPHQSVPIPPRS